LEIDALVPNRVRTLAVWCLGLGCYHYRVVDVRG
jgi:hypothetical protein